MPKERKPKQRYVAKTRVVNESTTAANRGAAIKAGCRFYIGEVCAEHAEHGNVRYAANGQCIQCERAKFRARAANERAKRGGSELRKRANGGYSFVAFTLGSVAGIESWMASMARKQELVR